MGAVSPASPIPILFKIVEKCSRLPKSCIYSCKLFCGASASCSIPWAPGTPPLLLVAADTSAATAAAYYALFEPYIINN